MKILFILPINMISGGTFVTYTQAHALSSRGHDVSIAFLHDPQNIEVRGFPNFNLRTLAFSELLKTKEEFDVAFSTFWDCWYYLGDVKAKYCMSFVQSDERNFYENPLAPERPLVEQTYRDSSIPIITEAKWIESMLRNLGHQKVAYAPNGIDTNLFSPHGELRWKKSSKCRVLIEGPGGVSFKRVDLAFQVASKLDCEIVYVSTDGIIKPGWRKIATQIVARVPFEEMPAIYRSCDILLKLSVVEGFFGPPLEMMACGGACVVSRVAGFDEYIRDNENALVVELDDLDGAIAAVDRLIKDKNLRANLIQNGLKTADSMQWRYRLPFFEEAILKFVQSTQKMTEEQLYQIRLKRVFKDNILIAQKHQRMFQLLSRINKFLMPLKKLFKMFF